MTILFQHSSQREHGLSLPVHTQKVWQKGKLKTKVWGKAKAPNTLSKEQKIKRRGAEGEVAMAEEVVTGILR